MTSGVYERTEEMRRNIGKAMSERILSKEHKAKISKTMTGIPKSKKAIKNMRKAQRLRYERELLAKKE